MKKLVSLALACALLFAFGCISVFAIGETLTVSSATAEPGQTGVKIFLTSDELIEDFASLNLQLEYNKDVLTMTKRTATKAKYYDEDEEEELDINPTVPTIKQNKYPFNFSWLSAKGPGYFESTTLITFEFTVSASAVPGTDYPITITYYRGLDNNYTDGVNVNFTDDRTPLGLSYVAGKISVPSNEPTVNTITVSAAGKSAVFETEEAISGTVLVGLYDGNRLIEVYTYDAAAEIAPVFTADTAGKTIKALWWENLTTVKPLSAAKVLE